MEGRDYMLIQREEVLKKIRPFYDIDIIKVLIGSRRSGKSKMIELIINELKKNGIEESDIIYINFENLAYDEIDDHKKLNEYIRFNM